MEKLKFKFITIKSKLFKSIASVSFRYGLIGLGCFFGIYGILSFPLLPIRKQLVLRPEFLPFYTEIIEKIDFLIKVGLLQKSIEESLFRISQGYVIGALIGCSLGFIMGLYRRIEYFLDPPVTIIRYVPALAWVPLFILWFGIGELTKVLLIVLGVMSVTLVGAYHGVRDIPDIYFKAAKVLGANTKMLLLKVVFPAALPQTFAGLRLAIGTAWMIIVAAEIIASKAGLGYILLAGRNFAQASIIFIGIALIGLLAFITDRIGRVAYMYVTRWMKRGA